MAKKVKKTRKKKHRGLRVLLYSQIFLILVALGALAYYYYGGYAKTVSKLHEDAIELVRNSTAETFRKNQTSIAYDSNGQAISIMNRGEDRFYLTSEKIPQYAKDAAVSIEDKKFYQHKGYDFKAIIRAVWAMVRDRKVSQGASTITQQLARNIFLTQDKTWERKIEEIFIAVELEKKYSKDQILEYYLNNIYFGNGYYGLEAASQGYFNKDVNDLTVSQQVFLIGIPNRPNYYDPVTHMDHTLSRRNRILNNMLEDKKISKLTYNQALAEGISLERSADIYNNYVETFMNMCATKVLMELNGFQFETDFETEDKKKEYESKYQEAYEAANLQLVTGGYRIYTSIDLTMQAKLQADIDQELAKYTETGDDGIYSLQGAAVCIDNNTGLVRAIVGGRSQDLSGYTLNRAYQSYRQPGSAIKPLIVYTPALENGYTPDTIVTDQAIENGPENADGAYLGEITLRTAVAKSRNTVAWQIFNELTPHKCISYLTNMNFQKVSPQDEVPAASIGGFTQGVSPLEMAKGYATIYNDGKMRDAGCITAILDAKGNKIYQSKQEAVVIYQETAAREMTDILTSVFQEGTARGYALSNMACAGKTGTTNKSKDGWFVGYTPYYTTSVWVGYDQPRTLKGLAGSNQPLSIWYTFMKDIHSDLSPMSFPPALNGQSTPDTSEENVDQAVEDSTNP